MLSRAEAWREIARRIAEGEWEKEGICHEIARLRWEKLIDDEMYCSMCDEIDLWVEDARQMGVSWSNTWQFYSDHGYWFAPPGEEADFRILVALFLSVIPEDSADD